MIDTPALAPLTISMHERDNVAIVANDGGLPAGTRLLASGLVLVDKVPQGHKVALADIAAGEAGAPLRRGHRPRGVKPIPAGSWVHERLLEMPELRARSKACRSRPFEARARWRRSTATPSRAIRNDDGSVGTRNILAITTTVQCVAGVVDFASSASRPSCCRSTRTSTTWSASSTPTAAASRSMRRAPIIPIRTLRNISLNPNFGGEVMVVSLGCEKLQPERLLPPGSFAIVDERNVADIGATASPQLDVVCLQDDAHVGFMSMIDSDHGRTPRSTSSASTRGAASPCRRARWWSACSAAAAMRSAASPPIRRSASAPTCWCAPARR